MGELPLGASAIEEHGAHTPETTLKALDDLDGWLLGPHDSAAYPEPYRSQLNPSGTIRKHFGLYANIRPAKSFPGGNAVVEGTDLVIARENTEGFYADRNTFRGTGEMMPTPDVAIMHGIITRAGDREDRPVRLRAGPAAPQEGHHRAQGQRAEDDHRPVPRRVPRGRRGLPRRRRVDDFHIDAMTVHLVRRADKFDVIVTENMFGDILSDLAGEIAGSLGIAPSLNSSDTHAMAQAAHGSAPDIAGQDIANPIAMILSSAMLLDWLGARHDDPRLADAAAQARGRRRRHGRRRHLHPRPGRLRLHHGVHRRRGRPSCAAPD